MVALYTTGAEWQRMRNNSVLGGNQMLDEDPLLRSSKAEVMMARPNEALWSGVVRLEIEEAGK